MKNIITYIAFVILFMFELSAQEAVISEIFLANRTTGGMEWTEILVVRDNISLVGYTVRDNGSTGLWMGGAKFKDVDLWKNLRAGTIIIINHRGSIVDENKADGYIEIGAESSYYFETFRPDGSPGPLVEGEGSSLDFNTTHDMIQLRNDKGEHVHCVGFIGNGNYDVYNALPSTKAFHNQGVSQNTSVKVIATSLADYSAGLNPSIVVYNNLTIKGLPNKRNSTDFTNQLYWRELRQPAWSNPGIISTNIVNNHQWVELKWNAASTISDPNEGYLIVRFIDNNNSPLTLEDGKIYNLGQVIPPYKIIGYVPTLTKTEFIDKFEDGVNFECGRYYGYQIYAFRFRESDNDPATFDYPDPRNARGRQYNETSFASVAQAIRKEIPPTPTVKSLNGLLKFCSNVKVELESDVKDKSIYDYEWFSSSDGKLAVNDYVITVTKPGDYWLRIINKSSGCYSESNNIKIEIIEAPDAFVINPGDNKTFNKDTLIQLCTGQQLVLRGLSVPSNVNVKWIKDNSVFNSSNDITINSEGIYKFVAESGGLCSDTSFTVTVRYVSPDYSLSTNSLVFDADSNPEQDLIITNNSNKELIIQQSDINIIPLANFKIIAPTNFPITIAPKLSATIKIRFEIVGFGDRQGKITINSFCNYSQSANLSGSRQNIGVTRLDPDVKEIDFGVIPTKCNISQKEQVVKVISTGSENSYLYKPYFKTANFEVVSNLFNTPESRTIVSSNGEITFGVRVIATSPGVYYDTLRAPYIVQSKNDTSGYVVVVVKAELFDPSLNVLTSIIDVSADVTCKKTLDTFIVVRNSTDYNILVDEDIADPRVNITNTIPKTILKNSTDTINIRINFSDKNEFDININYYNFCSLISSNIRILPPKIDLDISLAKDTIDFGAINTCKIKGDVIETAVINSSDEGASIGIILHNGTTIKSDLFSGKILSKGNSSFDIRLPESVTGSFLDSIVFFVEPCNEKYTLYIKGYRNTPSKPNLSLSEINFGTDNIGNSDTRTLTLINENQFFEMKIDSVFVPLPFILVSHTKVDFPITINPSGVVDFVIEYKRESVGNENQLMRIYSSEPCLTAEQLIIKGITIDNRTALFKAYLPNQAVIELGKEQKLPITFEFDERYSNTEIDIREMIFHLSFDPINMNLRSALIAPVLDPNASQLIFDDNSNGKLNLTLLVTNSSSLKNGSVIDVIAKPLLGNSLNTKVVLDSVTILSKIPSKVETNETDITIIGDCILDSRLLTVNGSLNIVIKGNSDSETLTIDYSTVSDEYTELSLFDYNGNLIEKIYSGNQKHGLHSIGLNTNQLSSGVYMLLLKNGIRNESILFQIIK
ncbi:hypothetical protein MASR1M45_03620 [Candidatus Kapaibacterium sp.]